LHAAPKKADSADKSTPATRLAALTVKEEQGEDQPLLELPPVDAAQHLIDYLFEVGPSVGGEVLTFSELQAWQASTGTVLTSWEAITLRRLSGAYLSELNAASDPQRPAPFFQASVKPREVVSSQLASMFDRLEKQDAKTGVLPRPKRLRT